MSGPHGLVADRDGAIWFTANFAGYIGKLDVATSKITEYKLPSPDARDPHTPLFDRDGILWFTVQSANMIGRLDPTSEADQARCFAHAPFHNPYGMVITSKGVPFFCEFSANKLASIDPTTMTIHEYHLPHIESQAAAHPPSRPTMSFGTLDYARGYLGGFNAATGEMKEYPSPGGPQAQPYGIAFAKGAVWYSESGVRPNTLVRFDPTSERFQTWPIPSGGGVVRNMMVDHDGNIVIAESGVDRVALVQITK